MKDIDNLNLTTGLGQILHAQYETVKADRTHVEDRWLRALRRYKGEYSPDELAKLPPGRSRVHSRITRTKVKTATARLMDLVFPAGSDNNWDMVPPAVTTVTPDPDTMFRLVTSLQRMPTEDEIRIEMMAQATRACGFMKKEIQAQLEEAKYRRLMKLVIQSGNLFGTGILKGPLVNRTYKKTWTLAEDGSWKLVSTPQLSPFIDFTPIWEMYPETQATTFSEARYNYQRSIMPKHQVLELSSRPDFSTAIIKRYLKEHPDGDAVMLPWETELRRLGWNLTGNTVKGKRFEVVEYWGVLEAKDLIEIGLEVPDDSIDEFWSNVWLLGSNIIKMEVQPIDGMQLPYYAYYWDKDETSIFGEGIPDVIKDDDMSLSAATRAMLDNAALTAGLLLEVNDDLLTPDEKANEVHPFKIFHRNGVGVEAQYPAVREIKLDSHTQEYLTMINSFSNNIHEATIPSIMHGEATSKGSVGRTSSGLGMLMGAAQITFKDQLFSLDDDVQQRFIEAAYHWNMQFNPKKEIKGDFNVVVKGTSSLVAREIRAQNLDQFANSTANPYDAPYIDRQALNVQRAKVLELGEDIVRTPEQAFLIATQQALRDGTESAGTEGNNPVPNPSAQTGGLGASEGNPLEPAQPAGAAIPSASPFPGATTSGGVDNSGGQ